MCRLPRCFPTLVFARTLTIQSFEKHVFGAPGCQSTCVLPGIFELRVWAGGGGEAGEDEERREGVKTRREGELVPAWDSGVKVAEEWGAYVGGGGRAET